MRTLEFLSSLIAFPSVSSTSNVEVTNYVESVLGELGFQSERLNYKDGAGISKSCVAGRIGPETGRGLAWFGHTDVVPATTWNRNHEPWQANQENDRIYGRGSCDMKGPIACILAAAASVDLSRLKQPLTVVCTADEEVGMAGAKKVAANSTVFQDCVQRQSRGIIGEPTQLHVVHAHKGGVAFRVTSEGFAAHSSTSEGVCSNYQMIPFLAEMHDLHQRFETQPAWHDDRFQPSSVSMNLLINDGTSAMNITPGQTECKLYLRPTPAIDADQAVGLITAAAARHDLQIEVIADYRPMFTDPNSDFVRQMLTRRQQAESQTVSYGTDGSFFTGLKDLVVFGPGDIQQAHKDDEWISLEQLTSGTQLYADLIEEYCCAEAC